MPHMRDMPRADILFKFEELYYSRVPRGKARLASRIAMGRVMNLINKAKSRLNGGYPILYLT
jgi:hypothetical protein